MSLFILVLLSTIGGDVCIIAVENCSVVLLCLLAFPTKAFCLMLLGTMHNETGLMMTEVKKLS